MLCLSGASVPSSSSSGTLVLSFLLTQVEFSLVRKDWLGLGRFLQWGTKRRSRLFLISLEMVVDVSWGKGP